MTVDALIPVAITTKRVAIIDDAYDVNYELADEQKTQFWTDLQNDRGDDFEKLKVDFDAFQQAIGMEIREVSQLDEKVIEQLWNKRTEYAALQSLIDQLFEEALEKLEPLGIIEAAIAKYNAAGPNILFKVDRFPTVLDVATDLKGFDIVLLDYRLGSGAGSAPIDNSKKIAEDLYAAFSSDSTLPLLILMSSDASVLTNQDEFRTNTKWLKGLFYCILKNDLAASDSIELYFLIWNERAQQGLKINEFVEALITASNKGREAFVDGIKDLSLEDYAYISNFSLLPEEESLGEYMFWLFNAYLQQAVFEKDEQLNEKKKLVDSIVEFDPLPKIAQLSPSMKLVDMYESALFTFSNMQSGLRQGLTWINKDQQAALMLLNGDCDLMRCPIENVTLIHGELQELSSGAPLREHDVKLIRLTNGVKYRIRWDWKKAQTSQTSGLEKSLEERGFSKFGILRSPFFSRVQQYYVNEFSRIALPVSPPIYQNVRFEIFLISVDKAIPAPDNLGFLISKGSSHEMEFRFYFEFARFFTKTTKDIIDGNAKEAGGVWFTPARIQRLEKELAGFNEFFSKNSAVKLNHKPLTSYFKDIVRIGTNLKREEVNDFTQCYFILNIISANSQEVINTTEAVNESAIPAPRAAEPSAPVENTTVGTPKAVVGKEKSTPNIEVAATKSIVNPTKPVVPSKEPPTQPTEATVASEKPSAK